MRLPTKSSFKDGGKVYLLDATVIELPLSLFRWATYRASKGAMKLHVGLAADGYLPSFVDMTAGRVHEINKARELRLPRGSWVVFDRGYTDYQWYQDLTKDGVHFVTRLKRGAAVQRWPLKIGQSVKVGCTSQIRSDTHEYHTTQTLFSRVQG